MFDYLNHAGKIVKGESCSYKLIEQIGSGASAKVYKAQICQAADLGEFRAIKIYSSRISVSEEHFLKELISKQPGEYTRFIMHYELFYSLEINRYCLVMELGQGSLASAIEQSRWNRGPSQMVEQRNFIIYEIAQAISDLNQKNFTHRDVKPENVLLMRPLQDNERPSLKLADFGLTKDSKLLATVSIGTTPYSAPEIQNNSNLPYSDKVDVWALGCIWFWLQNAGEDQLRHNFSNQSQSNIDIAVKNLNLNDPLATLLNKTLKLDSSARISIEEFLREFEEICPYLKQNIRAAPAVKQLLDPSQNLQKSSKAAPIPTPTLIPTPTPTPTLTPPPIPIPIPIPFHNLILDLKERISNLEMKVGDIAKAVARIQEKPSADDLKRLEQLKQLEESLRKLGVNPPQRIEIMGKKMFLQAQQDQIKPFSFPSQNEITQLEVLKEKIHAEIHKQFCEAIQEIKNLVKDLLDKIENIQSKFQVFLDQQQNIDSGMKNAQIREENSRHQT